MRISKEDVSWEVGEIGQKGWDMMDDLLDVRGKRGNLVRKASRREVFTRKDELASDYNVHCAAPHHHPHHSTCDSS